MSTNINVTIGDARLLQQARERAAANQQALVARQETQTESAALQEALERAVLAEDPSNSVVTDLLRRPAAQRRKKETQEENDPDNPFSDSVNYNLLFVNKIQPETVLNSLQIFDPGPWSYTTSSFRIGDPISCPAEPPPSPNTSPYTLQNEISERVQRLTDGAADNYHTDFSQIFRPNLRYLGLEYPLSSHLQDQTADSLSIWYVLISRFIEEYTTVCGFPFRNTTFSGRVDSVGPPFPRQTINSRFGVFLQSITTTSQYVYFSALIRERRYDLTTTTSGISSEDRFVVTRNFTATDYGYYLRFDVKTRSNTLVKIPLAVNFLTSEPTRFFSQPSSFISLSLRQSYAANLLPDDPRKSLYQNTTDPTAALDKVINEFGYDPETGAIHFYETVAIGPVGDLFFYSGSTLPNVAFSSVVLIVKAAKTEVLGSGTPPRDSITISSPISGLPSITFTFKHSITAADLSKINSDILAVVPRAQR
jgi:hypothetical protein